MSRGRVGLRVATYNLYLGADLSRLFAVTDPTQLEDELRVVREQLDATRTDERMHAVAAVLARERPHLVGLQEVSRWTAAPLQEDGTPGPREVVVDGLALVTDALAAAGCDYTVHAVNENFSGSLPVGDTLSGLVGANAVLVRSDVEVLGERTATFEALHEVRTGLGGLRFPVLRSWGSVDVRVQGRPVRFVCTHTEAYDAATRDAQLAEVVAGDGADLGAPAGGRPAVVLVGDLNAEPHEVALPPGWTDAWTAGVGEGLTWGRTPDLSDPGSALQQRIDYVWTRDAVVRSCRVVGAGAEDRSVPHRLWPSDHAGVVADLEV